MEEDGRAHHLAKLGILVGGKSSGSTMIAISRACQSQQLPAEVHVVVAPNANAPAYLNATAHGLRAIEISPKTDPANYAQQLAIALKPCTWICLAGYLRLLPPEILRQHPNHILNIHPALLPKFGGKGMYGIAVHEAVLDAGETETGCTVHYVNEHYDEGAILLQKRCPVLPNDTPEVLMERVKTLEHPTYIEALNLVLQP